MPPEEIERGLTRTPSYQIAIAWEKCPCRSHAVPIGQTEPDRTDGLVFRTAVRPGHTGYRDRVIGIGSFTHAECHLFRDFRAYSTKFIHRFLRHTESPLFSVIRICDRAFHKILRRTRKLCE